MLDFQCYQLEFTAHIRNPKLHPKPAQVAEKRMAIYRDAVFNNLLASISACFPVCQKVIGSRAWRKLARDFIANHAATSPIFREIPFQFLQYLNTKNDLPIHLKQLAHYEWVELAVSNQMIDAIKLSTQLDMLNEIPVIALAHKILQYDYPVHKISAAYKPTLIEKVYLLVYRNRAFKVKFIELNAMTFKLLTLIDEGNLSGKQALISLQSDIKEVDTQLILKYGMSILFELINQEAIIGSVKLK